MKDRYILLKNEEGEVEAQPNPKYWNEISRQKYELLLNKSSIPDFYHNIDFDDYKGDLSKDVLHKCMHYSQHCFEERFNHVHLYLYGGNSSQKTALMCNIGKALIKQGKQVKFVLSSILLNHMMKLQGYNREEDSFAYIQLVKQADVVLIDDVFASDKNLQWKNNSFITMEWDSLLRELFVSNKKVIMTSNISVEIIKQEYGESLFELIDRNCVSFQCLDNIKKIKKDMHKGLFDGIEKRN